MFPESFDKANFFSSPKSHTRRPDHEWDHIMRGEDIQNVWVTNSKGDKEREIDGNLKNYNLRTKSVDPSELGVDTVKQYSGYLDDEEDDKHLFYCKCITPLLRLCIAKTQLRRTILYTGRLMTDLCRVL
jgi:cathepsin A (carboxypeptidase C)